MWNPSPSRRETGIASRAERAPCSPRCRGRAHRPRRPTFPKRGRAWSPGGPVDQFDRVDGREVGARGDLCDAAKIACCNHIRSQSLDSPDFALAQPPCDVRLHNIVGPRRAAAEMTLRYVLDREAQPGEQILRLPRNSLSMLQRAGGVIGDGERTI